MRSKLGLCEKKWFSIIDLLWLMNRGDRRPIYVCFMLTDRINAIRIHLSLNSLDELRPHNTAVRISGLMRNSALAHVAPADHRPGMPGELVLDLGEQGGDALLSFPVGGKGFFLVGFPVHAFVFLSGCSVLRDRPASCPITLGRRLKSSG